MKLEDQVCSLELAKRLKELGVKQESVFTWYQSTRAIIKENKTLGEEKFWTVWWNRNYTRDQYSAFTVAELGEMLPEVAEIGLVKGQLRMVLVMGKCFGYRIDYRNEKVGRPIFAIDANEANARAKMVIHLIEKKIVNV